MVLRCDLGSAGTLLTEAVSGSVLCQGHTQCPLGAPFTLESCLENAVCSSLPTAPTWHVCAAPEGLPPCAAVECASGPLRLTCFLLRKAVWQVPRPR